VFHCRDDSGQVGDAMRKEHCHIFENLDESKTMCEQGKKEKLKKIYLP